MSLFLSPEALKRASPPHISSHQLQLRPHLESAPISSGRRLRVRGKGLQRFGRLRAACDLQRSHRHRESEKTCEDGKMARPS